jgi:CRP-like cAMP-binding protein
MGADDYITKPFEDIELLNAIEVRLKKAAVLDNKYPSSMQGINQFISDVKNSGLINQLAEQYDVESYTKKQTLYQETKRPKFLYYLVKGKVKGFKTHEDGKEYITNLYSDGDFIGYPALIEEKNYDDNAVVLEDSEIMQIPKEDFLKMIYGNMDVAAKFIRIITQNVKEKEERLLNLAYSSLRKRVAKALIDIQSKFNNENIKSPLEISREDFAHYVGTATESLIRTLSDFKSEKLIEIKEGKISVINNDKLKNLLY